MKALPLSVILWLVVGSALASSQSGRKSTRPPPAPPAPVFEEQKETPVKTPVRDRPEIVAVPNEEYKCVDDDSLVVVSSANSTDKIFAPNEVTVKAKLLSRPKPEYTSEARRRAVEGAISIRVVVLPDGKVSSVNITGRGGPFGLNESAIHAACKMEFVPAAKDGERVSQWFKTDIVFRLGSSIGR